MQVSKRRMSLLLQSRRQRTFGIWRTLEICAGRSVVHSAAILIFQDTCNLTISYCFFLTVQLRYIPWKWVGRFKHFTIHADILHTRYKDFFYNFSNLNSIATCDPSVKVFHIHSVNIELPSCARDTECRW